MQVRTGTDSGDNQRSQRLSDSTAIPRSSARTSGGRRVLPAGGGNGHPLSNDQAAHGGDYVDDFQLQRELYSSREGSLPDSYPTANNVTGTLVFPLNGLAKAFGCVLSLP